ncbi:hypothetical protein BGZ60DRAFT_368585 [Tricladium varicosporioides]|nr:hypothetical protein BGZ60DRAFT_368585 [Hymenoscyphus varicosporioides]
MSSNPTDRRSLLHTEGSGLSDLSATLFEESASEPRERHAYHRASSSQDLNLTSTDLPRYASSTVPTNTFGGGGGQGLGLSSRSHRPPSISRVPVGGRSSASPNQPPSATFSTTSSKSQASPSIPDSSNPLLTPPWHRLDAFTREGLRPVTEHTEDGDGVSIKGKASSFHEDLEGDTGDDGGNSRRISMNNDNDETRLMDGCPAKRDIHSSRRSWLSVSILALSIYSTVFSGIWLVLAIVQPRYGRRIRSGHGAIPLSTASTLFALFAKTIELSFVTVFVTFLGQVLSRRSLIKDSRGITISEMAMRHWVIQPGSMITHWQNLKQAGLSVVGAITLTAAFVAMFYTTASDSLVSPHLKISDPEERSMTTLVRMSYANPTFIGRNCRTPISAMADSLASAETCLSITHAGESYHNGISFLATWAGINAGGEGISSSINERPKAPAMLFDNTTVTGSWVYPETSDVKALYDAHKRVINNVTLAMPHVGLYYAARDPENRILQPEELGGVGEYSVSASLASPALNVLCVNAKQSELAPLIYTEWPHAITNSSDIPHQRLPWAGYESEAQILPGKKFLNSTPLDDIFLWGEKYNRQPPTFGMWPIEYNSIVNVSVHGPSGGLWGADSNYLLIKAPNATTTDWTLCQLRSFNVPSCSTKFNMSGTSGAHLESHCEDPNDSLAYIKTTKSPIDEIIGPKPDYRDIGSTWIKSLALNTGISNANASNGRILSQFVIGGGGTGGPKLSPLLPSIAEQLAVLAGNTLLMSSAFSSPYHYWNYSDALLTPGARLPFKASVASQEYTSGWTQEWQKMFYVVLVLVFVTNVFCLVYFFLRSGLVTDFTEPQNLFALAVNSPPSARLGGSCGGGPEGDQLNIDWHVKQEESSGHFFIKDGGNNIHGHELRPRRQPNVRSVTSYSKLSVQRRSWL